MTAMTLASLDGLRREDEIGEFWSARDLCPVLGYDRWENFTEAINRAIRSVNAAGQQAPDHIRGATKLGQTGLGHARHVLDYRLTRFGAYMVTMNGDVRKPEIANAQTYFAVRTREAELVPQANTRAIPSHAEALRGWAAELEAREIRDARIAELEPRAEVADKLLDADGDLSVSDTAKALTRAGVKVGEGRLFRDLSGRRWIFRAPGDGRWRVYQTAIETGYMSVLPSSHYHPKTGVLVLDPPQPRVTPKGLQKLLGDYGAAS